MVTLRLGVFEEMNAEQRWAWTKRWLNSLRQLFADNDNLPDYAVLWGRGSLRVGAMPHYQARGEHIHVLVHTGGMRHRLEKTLRKRFGKREVDVTPASMEETTA